MVLSCVLFVRCTVFLAAVGVLLRNPILVALGDFVAAALPWDNFVDVHPIKFFQGATLAFDDKEVDNRNTDKKTASKDVSISEINLLGDKSGKEADQEVPEPVGCSRDGHALGAVLGWEQFCDNSPNHRTPGHGISSDEQACYDDHALARLRGVGGVFHIEDEVSNGGEDHEHNKHPDGSKDKRLATTEVLHNVQSSKCSTEVHSTEDTLRDEAVRNTGAFEDGSSLKTKQD